MSSNIMKYHNILGNILKSIYIYNDIYYEIYHDINYDEIQEEGKRTVMASLSRPLFLFRPSFERHKS